MATADTTLSTLKIHEYANYALAGATPIAILSSKVGGQVEPVLTSDSDSDWCVLG